LRCGSGSVKHAGLSLPVPDREGIGVLAAVGARKKAALI